MTNLLRRLDKICETAKKSKISILLDAEQTYRQPALDQFALYMSRKFNRDSTLVYNTYQMYLMDSLNKLDKHLEIAKYVE